MFDPEKLWYSIIHSSPLSKPVARKQNQGSCPSAYLQETNLTVTLSGLAEAVFTPLLCFALENADRIFHPTEPKPCYSLPNLETTIN